MMTFILSLIMMLLIVVAMAVGVIYGRGPIKGSCGGISSLGMGGSCDVCGKDVSKCEEASSQGGRD